MEIFNKSQLDIRSNPNLLINGDFSVSQRGNKLTKLVDTYYYCADHWKMFASDVGATYSQIAAAGTFGKGLGAKFDYETGATNNTYSVGGTWIEDAVSNYFGETMTFSAKVRPDIKANSLLYFQIAWIDNSGATNAGNDIKIVHSIPTNAYKEGVYNWVDVEFSFVIPTSWRESDSSRRHLVIYFEEKDRNHKGVFEISQAKLELGSVATPFVPDDPATNLAKCQRYFYTPCYSLGQKVASKTSTNPLSMHIAWQTVSGWLGYVNGRSNAKQTFPVEMRVKPKLTFWNGNGVINNFSSVHGTGNTTIKAGSIQASAIALTHDCQLNIGGDGTFGIFYEVDAEL